MRIWFVWLTHQMCLYFFLNLIELVVIQISYVEIWTKAKLYRIKLAGNITIGSWFSMYTEMTSLINKTFSNFFKTVAYV